MGAMSELPPSLPPTDPGPFGGAPSRGLIGRPPDIGTPGSRVAALVVVGVLYVVLSVTQNLTPYLMADTDEVGRKPRGGEVAKLLLLFQEAFQRVGFPTSGQFGTMAVAQFAGPDLHPADKLQGVLLVGETESPQAALSWLAAIRSDQDLEPLSQQLVAGGDWESHVEHQDADWAQVKTPDGEKDDTEAIADAGAMEALYTVGPGSLMSDQAQRLRDRYGWLGELATTPKDTPERAALYDDIPWAVALIVIVLVAIVVAGLGGLTMFVLAAVYFFGGRLQRRFVPPSPGGSVFLETFGVFLAGFAVLHFGSSFVAAALTGGAQPGTPAYDSATRLILLGTLGAQWVLLLSIFWPRVRGVSGRGWRESIGWYAPRGVWREVLAGVAGYFAGLPLLFGAMVFTVVLNIIVQKISGGAGGPPENPMVELVGTGDPLVIVLFVTLATVWAPIVEESLFRGAVFRHLRGRAGAFLCALATALLFAFMHSYGPLMTAPLIALGFTFAMIREWRGSIIGCATAHCLHNSTIMVFMLVGLKAMG